ncbi:MAG TPA: hypothetical protein PKD96_00275 [Candidatus Absconditabacterales bacterium]|nr:hypothetical protein [Candidatus Absconditabacterales bacterium]HMT26715.1 hypothetical protein [Candidatus Absconditabacterales bacterium]
MKNIKKFLILITSLISSFSTVATTQGLTIEVPPADYQDIVSPGSQKIQSQKDQLIELIQAINFYLRFSIGSIAMGVLLYGGYTLITAQGNEGKVTQATNIFISSGIGIGIAVFSYVAVRVIVNLF